MLPVSNMRGSKRLIVFATLLTALAVYCLSSSFSNSQHISSTTCHEARSLNQHTEQQDDASYYLNLNGLNSSVDARAKGERLLVLTTLKNASQHLERYFTLLDKTTYPNELISIGLLVTDSQDGTLEALEPLVANLQSRWSNRFSEINVFSRDYKTEIPLSSEGSPIEQEPYRRSVLARARNFLLASALRDYHSWVAWLDAEMYDYPPTIFEDLMEADVDVIVPNTLKYREDYSFWAHDRNNWAETDYSLEIQKNVGEDYLLTEGYSEMPTGRYLLVDMPTHFGKEHKVPLDAVGTSFTLVKGHVHREGANFPAFAYRHQVETEAFGKVAKAMGFTVYGIPGYIVYHL
ncbi:hypothetical protein VTP01DRAFT_7008 [Rhizomucor pusillus]|uniref:uncharacterized protein n=1 Tax=Rhizomucor pusillus TaxID=4840 RepID=UPI003743ADDC